MRNPFFPGLPSPVMFCHLFANSWKSVLLFYQFENKVLFLQLFNYFQTNLAWIPTKKSLESSFLFSAVTAQIIFSAAPLTSGWNCRWYATTCGYAFSITNLCWIFLGNTRHPLVVFFLCNLEYGWIIFCLNLSFRCCV